jgi:hypothetical protein
MKLCECGCGGIAPIVQESDKTRGRVKGQPYRFIHGHRVRTEANRGANHPNWTGGRIKRDGYILLWKPGHPRSDKYGYVREHIVIAEEAIKHPLPSGAKVHHFNEQRDDNRNPNLVICEDQAYHRLLHARARAYFETGNPNMRNCVRCKQWDSVERFKPRTHNNLSFRHSTCAT